MLPKHTHFKESTGADKKLEKQRLASWEIEELYQEM